MTCDLFDLGGETAVIVGGTGVLGGAIAAGLASCGARIAIVGRNSQRGGERVQAIETAGGSAIFCQADALDAGALHAARQVIVDRFGAVTTLVNAA
jgi:NAD(P)-dependent dehydrogenase (short-subunit alcohol dehydrogenase family)